MNFQIKIMLLSFFTTIIISLIILPILKKIKVGQIVRDDGPKTHLKKKGTPTMGGLVFLISTVIVFIIVFILDYKDMAIKNIIPILLAFIGFGLIGFIDDFKKVVLKNTKGLKPKHKMIGLFIIATIFTIYISNKPGIGMDSYIPFLKATISLPVYIFVPFSIFVMIATTNAINLTDGIDGLSSTISILILATLTIIGTIFNVKEITIIGTILTSTLLAFLIFNLNPAKMFMGDTGSLALGGIISVMAIYLKMPLILLIIALIPILETVSVIIQVTYFKKTNGKRFFKIAPIHHHFELSGWKENKVLTVFGLITLILCVIGIYSIV